MGYKFKLFMMKINQKLINFLLVFSLFTLSGCQENKLNNNSLSPNNEINNSSDSTQENKLQLTVSILPQKYFVEKIGGDLVSVNVMVEPGIAAETYEPSPQQLTTLSNSSAYITIGVPFEEAWLDKIKTANPQIVMINSGDGIEKIPLLGHHHHEGDNHDHNHENEKENHEKETESIDPHIWLSPKLAKIQAQNIYEELIKLDPKNQAIYQQNLDNFLGEIDLLDQQIQEKFANINRRLFMIYHPAWGYFAKDYNLEQISIEFEGQEATASELASLIKKAKENNIKVIFTQPQFASKTVDMLAREINAEVVILDDLAENWSQNLLDVADKLARSMQ